MTNTFPHAAYITAVVDALVDVGRDPADITLSACETCGSSFNIPATLTFDSATSLMDPMRWPNGLILTWGWRTGVDAADEESGQGPAWLWSAPLGDGSSGALSPLPVDAYANPVQIAAALNELDDAGAATKRRPGKWDGAPALEAAFTAQTAHVPLVEKSHEGYGYQSETEFRQEIVRALQACGVDPYEACDVDAAARFLAEDQKTNAPDEFWTVVKRHRLTTKNRKS